MNNLAEVLDSQGKYEEAEEMHQQALELREKVLGHEHPATLTSMNNLAGCSSSQGKYEEAEEMHRADAGAEGEDAGPRAPRHADEHEQPRGGARQIRASTRRPRRCTEQALELREKVLGHEHPDTLTSMNNLA